MENAAGAMDLGCKCKRRGLFNCCFDKSKSRNKSQVVFQLRSCKDVSAGNPRVENDRVEVAVMACDKTSVESPLRAHSWTRL